TEGDPGELLIRRIEANAERVDMSGSGLGLLTLMSDYNARLAWVFSQPDDNNLVCLEVFASLPIAPTYN
ncbi:MAG: ATP-binding protein, partial [Phyllobacterium sp.]